jgi:hypothetical protein
MMTKDSERAFYSFIYDLLVLIRVSHDNTRGVDIGVDQALKFPRSRDERALNVRV